MNGLTSFEIIVKVPNISGRGHQRFKFYGSQIKQVHNGAGVPTFYAPCWDLKDDRQGVINLFPDWTVKSIYFD